MRIYFVRHGQSEANVLRVISNRDLLHHLTDVGRQQAETLARSLADVPLAAIYASPIVRAEETAQIVAASRGLSIEIADALREPDCGIMEGRDDDAAWAEHDRVVHDWVVQRQFDSRIDGGESYNDLRARFVPLVEMLVAEHGNTDHNILLITHGSLLYLMLPLVLNNIDLATVGEYPMPNTGLIIAEERAAGLIGLEWCGVKLTD
ncbi:MAG TPA: histidine phosphatase family protein [Anaerolineae bacterium]|nr:histidine phosphatase family protein [Anaerolineae bacterium]